MKNVILFGGSGKLGMKVAFELRKKKYNVTAVVRNEAKAAKLKDLATKTLIADVCDAASLKDICRGFDVIVSTLGKSVSPNDRSRPGFYKVDLKANGYILKEGIAASVKKFVYVSAFNSENALHLNYFNAHHLFAEKLKHSGMDYSIIKPPAIMSSFADLVDMAKKGRLVTIGKGDKLTNPIYEGDLAEICVNSIDLSKVEIEAGGKHIYTRQRINELVQQHAAPGKKIRRIPAGVVRFALQVIRPFDRNSYDKIAFFLDVLGHDLIAPKIADTSLETYLSEKLYLE